jgi:hypothetical protein
VPASLLEILRWIPDHRRAEGKRFDLGTVLLYAILSMVSGTNSYRQMHHDDYAAYFGAPTRPILRPWVKVTAFSPRVAPTERRVDPDDNRNSSP